MTRCCGGSSSSIKLAAERHDPSTEASVAEALPHVRGGGLRDVYRVLEAPGRDPLKDAHAALDAAVREVCGFPEDSDYLGSLLGLNRVVARRIDEGHKVQSPGIPAEFSHADRLLSGDRIAIKHRRWRRRETICRAATAWHGALQLSPAIITIIWCGSA